MVFVAPAFHSARVVRVETCWEIFAWIAGRKAIQMDSISDFTIVRCLDVTAGNDLLQKEILDDVSEAEIAILEESCLRGIFAKVPCLQTAVAFFIGVWHERRGSVMENQNLNWIKRENN